MSTTAAPEDVLAQYLRHIRRHRLLTKHDEVHLAQVAEAGRQAGAQLETGRQGCVPLSAAQRSELMAQVRSGQQAQQVFVEANLRLVVALARRYRSSGVALEDLVQEGNLGLLQAVERFDWRRGFRFSTYASWWIRQAIAQGVRTSAHAIYRPAHVCDRVRLVQTTLSQLEPVLGRRPTPAELAAETGLGEEAVVQALGLLVEPRSLSEGWPAQDGELTLLDLIAGPEADAPFETLAAALLPAELERLLSPLDERERTVIGLRYGLGLAQPLTLTAVAGRMDLTSQRISQITDAAMAKLRHPSWRRSWAAVTGPG